MSIAVEQGRIHDYLSRVRVGRGGEKKLSVTDRRTERVVESRARDLKLNIETKKREKKWAEWKKK